MGINHTVSILFRLFAVAFRPPAIGAWADSIVSGSLCNDMTAAWAALELPEGPLAEFCAKLDVYAGRDAEEVLHELRREETRLFIGEDPLVENAEGTYLQRKHGVRHPVRMIGQHSVAVADFMKSCGVTRQERYNDCIDYLENECDFCGYLATEPQYLIDLGVDPLGKLDEFAHNHMLLWVPSFCAEVVSETKAPYYAGIALLMGAFIQEF